MSSSTRLAVALLSSTVLATTSAFAGLKGGTPYPTSCASDPSHATDGCDGANWSSVYINHNLLLTGTSCAPSCGAQSGQTLAYAPEPAAYNPVPANAPSTPRFIAGRDYPVGYITPKGSLQDPATATLPPDCQYYTPRAAPRPWATLAAPMVRCAAVGGVSTDLTLTTLEFGPTGGHGCTLVTFASSYTAHATITDSDFDNDANCVASGQIASNSIPAFLMFENGTQATVDVTFSMFNGEWLSSCCNMATDNNGYGRWFTGITYWGNANPTHRLTVKYSAFLGMNGANVAYLAANGGNGVAITADTGLDFRFNTVEGISSGSPYGHTDGIYMSAGYYSQYFAPDGVTPGTTNYPAAFIASYNSILVTSDAQPAATGMFYQLGQSAIPSQRVTGGSGDGSTVTLTWGSGTTFAVGSTIYVLKVNPSAWNGYQTVTASSSTSVSFANSTRGSWSRGGVVTNHSTGWASTSPYTVTNNTMLVGNQVRGLTAATVKASYVFGGSVGNNNGASPANAAGNVFTWDGSGDQPFSGMYDGTINENFTLGPQIDSTHWYINCTINGGRICPHPYWYNSPGFSAGPTTISDARIWTAGWGTTPVAPMDHGYFDSITISGNYIDESLGQQVPGFRPNVGTAGYTYQGMMCLSPIVSSNNINMRTGASLNTFRNTFSPANNCGTGGP